jgi:serine O-acetyltransferase
MNGLIKADLYRYDGLKGFTGLIKGLNDSGFRYTFLLRKVMQYKAHPVVLLYYRILKRLFTYRGYHISNEAQIGKGFSLYHRGTVYIGPVKIGKNCTVSHNVVVGRALKGGKVGRPTLGDNVWIGTGAVIVGQVNIGNDVMIAPNSFVNFDVPDHSLVIGNPGKFFIKDNPTKYYITNTLD